MVGIPYVILLCVKEVLIYLDLMNDRELKVEIGMILEVTIYVEGIITKEIVGRTYVKSSLITCYN